MVRKMLLHAKLATEKAKWTDPHVKAYALLQAHFSRAHLSADMAADQQVVLRKATRLLQVLLLTLCLAQAQKRCLCERLQASAAGALLARPPVRRPASGTSYAENRQHDCKLWQMPILHLQAHAHASRSCPASRSKPTLLLLSQS